MSASSFSAVANGAVSRVAGRSGRGNISDWSLQSAQGSLGWIIIMELNKANGGFIQELGDNLLLLQSKMEVQGGGPRQK